MLSSAVLLMLPLWAALLLGLGSVGATATNTPDTVRQRQITRAEVVQRATRSRPKRATISAAATCTTFFLQNPATGLYARAVELGSAGVARVQVDSSIPALRLQLQGTQLIDVDGNRPIGAYGAVTATNSYVFAGSQAPLICTIPSDGSLRCRRDTTPAVDPDTEAWSLDGGQLRISPSTLVTAPAFLAAVCA